jgi:hypothetical protein
MGKKKKNLYAWEWNTNGWSDAWAFTEAEALKIAKNNGGELYSTLRNFRLVGIEGSEEVTAYHIANEDSWMCYG